MPMYSEAQESSLVAESRGSHSETKRVSVKAEAAPALGEALCEQLTLREPHGVAQADCGRSHGSACLLSCRAGYHGGAEWTCDRGQWQGPELHCSRDCGPLVVNGTPVACERHWAPESCDAWCDVTHRAPPVLFDCGEDGKWHPDPAEQHLNCKPVDCHQMTLPRGGTGHCSGTFLGSRCEVTCLPGYAGGARNYTCDAKGRWEGPALACKRRDCGPLDVPHAHPKAEQHPSEGARHGARCSAWFEQECTMACNPGYADVTHAGYANFVCGADGVWQGELACEFVRCESPLALRFTHANIPDVTRDCDGNSYGSSCLTMCLKGYFGNRTTRRCAADGSWVGEDPTCETEASSLSGNFSFIASPPEAFVKVVRSDWFFRQSLAQVAAVDPRRVRIQRVLRREDANSSSASFRANVGVVLVFFRLSFGAADADLLDRVREHLLSDHGRLGAALRSKLHTLGLDARPRILRSDPVHLDLPERGLADGGLARGLGGLGAAAFSGLLCGLARLARATPGGRESGQGSESGRTMEMVAAGPAQRA